jgi:hypothetical protein
MAEIVYALCALTSLLCAILLFLGFRRSRVQLLFWSSWCFAFQAIGNIVLFVDKIVLPTEVDLSLWRLIPQLTGAMLLVYGLIKETAQ